MRNFLVEWHLCIDAKTIKVLYGLGGGSTSKNPCIIYYTHSKKGPIFDNSLEAKPMELNLGPWKPILDILLTWEHM